MNPIYDSLVGAVWLIWLAYWLIAARDAKPTQRIEPAASRASHVIPLGIAAWMIASPRLPGAFLGGSVFAPSTAVGVIGVALVAGGLGFAAWARRWLGRNWSGIVTLKQDHELIRGGPYRYVRHPIYTGILLAFVGSAVARDEWRGLVAIAVAALALWRKLRIEERWMIEQFGDAYRRFQAEVPALVPNLFRRPRSGSS